MTSFCMLTSNAYFDTCNKNYKGTSPHNTCLNRLEIQY